MKPVAHYVRHCPGCKQSRGLSQFRRIGRNRAPHCKVCEAKALPSELDSLNYAIRHLKSRLTRLQARRREIQAA